MEWRASVFGGWKQANHGACWTASVVLMTNFRFTKRLSQKISVLFALHKHKNGHTCTQIVYAVGVMFFSVGTQVVNVAKYVGGFITSVQSVR